MVLGISYQTMVAYLFVLILVVILLAVLATPIRWFFKILINSLVGTAAIVIFNFIGNYIDFTIGLNPASILTTGVLGIPGFVLLVFLRFYLF